LYYTLGDNHEENLGLIHDGILDELNDEELICWDPPKMYRMVEKYFQIDTFPKGKY
jgi:hypothetical protein